MLIHFCGLLFPVTSSFSPFNSFFQLGSLTRMTSKKNWVVLHGASYSGKSRVEVFKDEDSASMRNDPWRVIGLEQVTKVQMSPDRKEFILVTKEDSISFVCQSRADLDDWLRDLESVRRGGKFGSKDSPFDPHLPGISYI